MTTRKNQALLNIGILGYLLVLLVFFDLIIFINRLKVYRNVWGAPVIGLLMFLFVNGSNQVLGFNVTHGDRYLGQCILFALLAKCLWFSIQLSNNSKC